MEALVEKLITRWRKGKEVIDRVTGDFQDIDQLVDGVPLTREKDAPYVADTTIPGLVRDTVRSAIKQVPIFAAKVNGTKNSINAHICSFLLRDTVFNEDTFGKGLLSTLQLGGEQALKHGFCTFYAHAGMIGNDFGSTLRMVHYQDFTIEPGVSDGHESMYFQLRTNLTRARLTRLIEDAEKDPETTWNIEGLKQLLELEPQSLDYSSVLSDMQYNTSMGDKNTYEIITDYGVGPYNDITTFCPQIEVPLRVIKSKSKFGYPRQLMLVIDPVPLSPFGLSRVRLASPMQNFSNVFLQSVAKMQLLNADPPVLQRGRFVSPVVLKRGVRWETKDQNATAELMELSNSTLQNFNDVMSFTSAQMHNMFGRPPGGTMGGGSNNMGYSKTAPGVKMQERDIDISDLQLTNILENFLRQYALVALDIYISEQEGVTDLIVDDEAKNAINRIIETKNAELVAESAQQGLPPDMVEGLQEPIGDDNKITINWAELYDSIESWSVTIEMSLGKDELEEKKRGDIQDTLVTMTQNADPGDVAKQTKIDQLEDVLLEKSVPEIKRSDNPVPQEQPQLMPMGGLPPDQM